MYVHIYIHIQTHIWVNIYIYVHTYIYVHVYIYMLEYWNINLNMYQKINWYMSIFIKITQNTLNYIFPRAEFTISKFRGWRHKIHTALCAFSFGGSHENKWYAPSIILCQQRWSRESRLFPWANLVLRLVRLTSSHFLCWFIRQGRFEKMLSWNYVASAYDCVMYL